ncbi:MAG: ATP-binding protein [Bacteroidetes bacterium]|nr:ATP-binding protein [Bacteroidota bacterium]
MLFKINHIAAIEQAEVLLDGLTVIGGENDTGKSTVGKLLFAIVKGIARYEQDLNESKDKEIRRKVQEIYFALRRYPPSSKMMEEFSPNRFNAELRQALGQSNPAQITLFEDDSNTVEQLIQKKIDWVNTKFKGSERNVLDGQKVVLKLEELRGIALQEDDQNSIIKRALQKAFNSVFYAELSPKQQPNTVSEISLSEGDNPIFDLKIKNDKIEDFDLQDLLYFEDVTFVETPIILQLYEVIHNSSTLLEIDSEDKSERLAGLSRSKVSLHWKDLIDKLEYARYISDGNILKPDVLKKINDILHGEFTFEKDQRDFVFNKRQNGQGKKIQVRSVNTASGIKSFGIIQLLLQAGFVDNRSLLILDEPETHLHPKWQIEYARLLVELVKNDIRVMVTSHSPYLIQALKVFSDKEGIAENTHFHLASRKEKSPGCVIENVTDDLNRLFQKLSEPLQDLVWQ